jgi:hypothetical protein
MLFEQIEAGHQLALLATYAGFMAQVRNRVMSFGQHLQKPVVWSRGVTRWFRFSLSVADSFVCRCLTSWTLRPSSHPAHRTGQADLRHPALGESFTRSPTGDCSSAL